MEKLLTCLCFILLLHYQVCDCLNHNHYSEDDIIPLFVFGDSFFDAGNNNYINTNNGLRANFSPYGETFFRHPTGRFSDGRLIPDFIAEYAKMPLIPPYLENGQHKDWSYGVNFASGGSGALVETNAGMVIDLKAQVNNLENVEKEMISHIGYEKAKHLLSESVYLFSVGGNDFIDRSPDFSSYAPEDYVTVVVGNFTQVIKELHKKGARKFGFLSTFPMGCIPSKRPASGTCDEELTFLTLLYNIALSETLQDLEKQLNGFRYSYFNSVSVAFDIIDNSSKYGFKEVESACCGSGAFRGEYTCGGMRGVSEYELCENVDDYLFFDSFHPSEKGHRLLAELMWRGGVDVAWPSNLKSLFQITSYQGEVIKVPANTTSSEYF